MADRLQSETVPGYSTGSAAETLTTRYAYADFIGGYGRLVALHRPGSGPTLFEYDASGQRFRSGLYTGAVDSETDLATLQLVLQSEDQVTDTLQWYGQENGSWYAFSNTKAYPLDDSSDAVITATHARRLSGFSGSLAAESVRTDIRGNTTTVKTEVERANKKKTVTTMTSTSEVSATSMFVNGYLMEENSTTVSASTTYGYDGLGTAEGGWTRWVSSLPVAGAISSMGAPRIRICLPASPRRRASARRCPGS